MMPAFLDRRTKPPIWRYRKRVKGPDGLTHKLGGTPPTNTKRAAEAAERNAIAKLFAPAAQAREEKTIAQHAELWIEIGCVTNKPRTVDSKRKILDQHILPAFGDMLPSEVYQEHVDAFRAKLLQTPSRKGGTLEPHTIVNILSPLSRVIKYAQQNGYPVQSLYFGMKFQSPEMEAVPASDLSRLVANAHPRTAAIILLASDAGLRAAEIRGLRWSDLVELHREIRIVETIDTLRNVGGTKSHRARTVSATDQLWDLLQSLPRRGQHVITTFAGRSMGYSWMRDLVLAAYAASGVRVPAQPLHGLRHSYGSQLADSGAKVHQIKDMLGHASILTTQKYMHTDRDAMREASRRMAEMRRKAAPAVEVADVVPFNKKGNKQ